MRTALSRRKRSWIRRHYLEQSRSLQLGRIGGRRASPSDQKKKGQEWQKYRWCFPAQVGDIEQPVTHKPKPFSSTRYLPDPISQLGPAKVAPQFMASNTVPLCKRTLYQ